MATAREKAQEKIRKAQEAILAARNELRELDRRDERFGNEPVPGSVVRFERRFRSGRSYSYAAVRAEDGFWYLTGVEEPRRLTWEHLKGFVGDNELEVGVVWERRNRREVTWG